MSERFRNAVKFADPVEGMRLRSLERQLEVAKEALYNINASLGSGKLSQPMLSEINQVIERVYWLVEE